MPELLMSTRWLVAGGLCRVGSGGRQPYKVHWLLKGHFFAIKASRPLILHKKKRKKRERILGSFWADSFSPLSNFSPKHIKIPQNTLDSHLFSIIFKVVFLHSIFLSLVLYLGFEVQGCGCSFLAIIHTLFTLLLFLTLFA